MFSFWSSTDETTKTTSSKTSVPSTIFCGFTNAFDSIGDEEREEELLPSSPKVSERDTYATRELADCHNEDDDDSTVVSSSGVSVLSIDYNDADNVVDGGEKLDLSGIGDDDDESTVAGYDGEEDNNAISLEPEQNTNKDLKRNPSYAALDRKQSSGSAPPSGNVSNSNQIMQSVKFKGHPKAEAKRKELLKTLKHNISSHGRYSLKVADALKELGMFHETCGQCDISLTLYQESLDVYSSKLGDHNSNVTDLQMRLGRVNEKLGNENEALQWYALALHMIVDMSGNFDLTACDIRVSMSKIIHSKDFHKEAVKELKKALKGYRDYHGDEHESVAETVDLIADFYTGSGNHGKASNVRSELVKLRVALHGTKSPEVAEALKKWASCHEAVGDLHGALRVMKQSYVMFHDVEGADGLSAEETLEKIGFLYSKMDRAEKAIKAHTSVALTRKKRHGEHSVQLAASYLNLGRAYMDDNKPERALKALNRAMTCYGKANEADNDYICELMEALHSIGMLHLKTTDNEKALKTFQKEKSVRQRYMEYDQLGLAGAVKCLGEAKCALSKFAESKETLVEALQIYDRVDGRKTLFAETMYVCGQALEGLNDESRAFTCYKEAVQIFAANGYDEDYPPMKEVVLKLISMGLHDITSLTPSLRCQLIDGESQTFEF